MYLLFPLKVFEVRKKITKVKYLSKENPKYDLLIKEIKGDILKVTKKILEHILTVTIIFLRSKFYAFTCISSIIDCNLGN